MGKKNRLLSFVFFVFFSLLVASEACADEQWTLQRCINYAMEHNPDLQVSDAQIAVSTYNSEVRKKLFLPRLDLTASTGYLTGEPTSPFALVRGFTEEGIKSKHVSGGYVQASLHLDIPILREGVLFFSHNAPSMNMALNQNLMDKSSYLKKKTELLYDISMSYFELLKTNEDIKSAEEHIKSLKLHHELIKAKYSEELVSKNELLMSEVKLATAEKELTVARNSFALLISSLALKMGMDSTQSFAISDVDLMTPALTSREELIDRALSNRHEIKEQEMRIAIALEEQRLVQRQRYPELSVVSTYSVGNGYSTDTTSFWISSLQLNVPLIDFGATSAQIRSQEARVVEEEKVLLARKYAIKQEVIAALADITDFSAEIKLMEKIVEQSMENARLTRAQFEQNLIPLSPVVEAEYLVYENRKTLAKARYDLRIAYLQLEKATGSKMLLSSQQ